MKINWIGLIAVLILALVAILGYAIFFLPDAGEQLKTVYAQSLLLALAAVTGYFFGSTAEQTKRNNRPDDALKVDVVGTPDNPPDGNRG